MDFLNKSFAQISDLFRSMTPGARITSGLLLAAIVISLAYLVQGHVSAPDAYLFNGQSFAPNELNNMETAFAKADLNGHQVQGTQIRIPRGQQAAYVAALAEGNALPVNFSDLLDEPLKGGIFESEKQRQQRIVSSKQKLLSMIVSSMSGIEKAIVIYDVQEGEGLSRKRHITASVTVQCRGNQALEEERVPAIRHLVASSIAGLTPENVAVTDLTSMQVFSGGNSAGGSSSGLGDAYSQTKRGYEKEYAEKIRNALRFVAGAIVTTNVELDPQIHHEEKSTQLDPKAITVEMETTSKMNNSSSGAPAGRPGLASQGGVMQPGTISGASSGTKSDEEFQEERQRSVVGTTEKQTRRHGLTPQRVTASIGVPTSYFEKVWHERNPVAAGEDAKKPDAKQLEAIQIEELKKIQDYVLQTIPLPPGAVPDLTPLVKVVAFQQAAPAPPVLPGMTETSLAWFGQYWTTLGMGLLGLVSLGMLRSMVRSSPSTSAPAPAGSTLPFPTSDSEPDAGENTAAQRRLKRRGTGEPSLREELADVVKEDPDSAANILRSWIGNAS